MEKITVKFLTRKHYTSDEDIKNLILYISGEGSNKNKEHAVVGVNGLNYDPEKAGKQIIKMQKMLNKASKRRAYHMVVSFPIGTQVNSVISASRQIGEMLYREKGFQCYYGVHTKSKSKHLHIHFCINALSYVTGKKWHANKEEFEEFIDEVRTIAQICV